MLFEEDSIKYRSLAIAIDDLIYAVDLLIIDHSRNSGHNPAVERRTNFILAAIDS